MKFTKMHGLGNDYVYVNGFEERVENPGEVSKKIADRHFGIGGDGLILILPSDKADVRMRIFNADGSEGDMCGNGSRCVAKYAFDHGLTKNNPMRLETGNGILTLDMKTSGGKVEQVTVKMGQPVLELMKIPVDAQNVKATAKSHEFELFVENRPLAATFVNIGNPHAIIFVNDVDAVDVAKLGPVLEHHPAFPKRANIHWAQIISRREMKMRTWERGSGITLACGTGASSVCIAAVLTGRADRDVRIHLPGGDLQLEWREADNNVYMTGPATEVFSGEWSG
jgi:diaminopimelate epimerase